MKTTTPYTPQTFSISEQQLEACFHQAYSSIRNVIIQNLQQGNFHAIRKLFISNEVESQDSLVHDMINESVIKLNQQVTMPILFLRKVMNYSVTHILHIIMIQFSCNSVSKLLRYLGLNRTESISEKIRQASVKKLKDGFYSNFK